jgi:hypothetical protein
LVHLQPSWQSDNEFSIGTQLGVVNFDQPCTQRSADAPNERRAMHGTHRATTPIGSSGAFVKLADWRL